MAPGHPVGSSQIAVNPTPTPGTSPRPADVWEDSTPVRYVDGELEIRPGVVVHKRTDEDYFVVWRVIDSELDVITTPPRDVVGASFDELLSYARGRYASGEGLR